MTSGSNSYRAVHRLIDFLADEAKAEIRQMVKEALREVDRNLGIPEAF